MARSQQALKKRPPVNRRWALWSVHNESWEAIHPLRQPGCPVSDPWLCVTRSLWLCSFRSGDSCAMVQTLKKQKTGPFSSSGHYFPLTSTKKGTKALNNWFYEEIKYFSLGLKRNFYRQERAQAMVADRVFGKSVSPVCDPKWSNAHRWIQMTFSQRAGLLFHWALHFRS